MLFPFGFWYLCVLYGNLLINSTHTIAFLAYFIESESYDHLLSLDYILNEYLLQLKDDKNKHIVETFQKWEFLLDSNIQKLQM